MAKRIAKKADGRRNNGSEPGTNRGGGRRAKDPVDYKPNEETLEKRRTAREAFEPHVQQAIDTIVKGAAEKGAVDRTQLSAAKEILDRVFGRPAQEHIFSGDDSKPPIRVDGGVLKNVTTPELVQAARAIIQARRAVGNEAHEE